MSEHTLPPTVSLTEEKTESTGARVLYGLRLLFRDRSGTLGVLMVGVLIFVAAFAPYLTTHDPADQSLRDSKRPPAWIDAERSKPEFPLGTDSLGRDLYTRLLYGSRVSLTVGLFGVLIAGSLGLVIGLISGYAGGRVDAVIMGIVNIVLAFPYLLFVVVIASVLGRSLFNVIWIFGITDAPIFVYIARAEVLRLRESGFVESARSIGASRWRIIFDHILPNLIGPLMTVATFEMSAMIFYEASLGFLGLSVPPEIPSWGNMLEAGRQYLQNLPWIATFPGLAIMFASLGMNLMGEWLRNVLDPRLRRARN